MRYDLCRHQVILTGWPGWVNDRTVPWSLSRTPEQLPAADILVLGAGCAGVVAAIAAARRGARVTLAEREGTLGGISTGVLDTFYGFWTPGHHPARVVDGIPGEIVRELSAAGAAFERPNTYGAGTGVTYNPEILRTLYDRLCDQAGVTVLLHAAVADVAIAGRRVREVLLTSGSSLLSVTADQLVDATGDAVAAHLAGAESEGWSDIPNPQSLTVTFTMAPVDQARLGAVSRDQLLAMLGEAIDSGQYDLPRKDGSLHVTTVPGVEFVHMTRVSGWDPRNPAALSDAEREGRRQAVEYARFLRDRVPGFESARICWLARRIGVRESRRVVGRYWLTREDVMAARRFPDGVVRAGAPIEDHGSSASTRWDFLSEGSFYEIPFRSLLPRDLDGIAVAGRCLSASHDAHASARNMAQCMAMGQAAGTAAAIAADRGVNVGELDDGELRRELAKAGAVLGDDL